MQRPAAEHVEVSVTSEGQQLQSSVRSEVLQPETSAAVLLTQLTERQQVQKSPVQVQYRQVESTRGDTDSITSSCLSCSRINVQQFI